MKQPLTAIALNPDAIETFVMRNKVFEVRFKDASVLTWKVRQTVLVSDGDPQLNSNSLVFPGALLIGGNGEKATGGKLTRCVGCGKRVNPEGSDTIESRCFSCFLDLPGPSGWCSGLAYLAETGVLALKTWIVNWMAQPGNKPNNLAHWDTQDDYQAKLMTAYFRERKVQKP